MRLHFGDSQTGIQILAHSCYCVIGLTDKHHEHLRQALQSFSDLVCHISSQ